MSATVQPAAASAPKCFEELDTDSFADRFVLLRTEEIAERGITVTEYNHEPTGGRVVLVDAPDQNKCFSCNFRTLPKDNTGVPHILEHSVLCGSARYPSKEPFVDLLKGSLKTFLNAMTAADRTMYPVASQNKQDFFNLVNVYLDACLNPRILDPAHGPRILKQEGWHYMLDDAEGPVKYSGVVYNEMKGVYSQPDQTNAKAVRQALFSGHPIYSIDSGGDPRAIPTLEYAEFVAFHRRYYHPSNGLFYVYGDPDELPHIERLALLDEYLRGYTAPAPVETIPWQPLLGTPYEVTKGYAVDADAAAAPTQFVTVAWLLNSAPLDPKTTLALSVLNDLLLGLPTAGLQKPLLESRLGASVIGGGFGLSLQQATFAVGLKGVAPGTEAKEAVASLILSSLARIAEEGFADDAVEASMNSMEFGLRSSSASPMKGLSFGMAAVTAWTYERDPIAPLRFADTLRDLKDEVAISGGEVFVSLLRDYVLGNGHRATVSLVPEPELARRVQEEEEAELEAMESALDADGKRRVLEATSALRAAQSTPDDPAALATIPQLSTADLNRQCAPPIKTEVSEISVGGGRGTATLLANELPTDGIVYMDVCLPMEGVAMADVPYLPLLGAMISSFGTSTHDETTFSRRIDAQTGGLSAGPQTQAVPGAGGAGFLVGERDSMSAYWMVSGKASVEKSAALFGLASEMLTDINLDNRNRVVEILTQALSSAQSSVVTSASAATSLLQARLSLAGDLDERMAGLSAMATYREALAQAKDDWPSLLARFERMRAAMLSADGAIINLSADASSMVAALRHVPSLLESLPCDGGAAAPRPRWAFEPTESGLLVPAGEGGIAISNPVPIHEGLMVPTQVNYVAKCGALYAPGEPVSGATSVITRYLRTAYLWDSVRVQGGAYGCSLSFSQVSGIATYSSYRDPNLANTLQAYDRTGQFLRSNRLSAADLSKAIIGAVGDLDAPQSVYGKGSMVLRRHMLGVTTEDRQIWRDQVLGTTPDDFVAFADRLDTLVDGGSVAAVASETAIAQANSVLPEGRRLEARRIL